MTRPAVGTLLLLSLGPLPACDRGEGETDRIAVPPTDRSVAGVVGEVHLGPGPVPLRTMEVRNPFADDPGALLEGERLYVAYNCAGCHGSRGGGGMGPPLRDESWIYGGDAVSIYRSIMEGRPEGMPTWQGLLPDEQAWKIVAYIQSMGGPSEQPPGLMPPVNRSPAGTAAGSASGEAGS